jgi:hypothetical protein
MPAVTAGGAPPGQFLGLAPRSCDDVTGSVLTRLYEPAEIGRFMHGLAVQDGPQAPLAGGEHPVGRLGSDGADPAFGMGDAAACGHRA